MATFETIRPAPAMPAPTGSLGGWAILLLAMAIVVLVGIVLASRR